MDATGGVTRTKAIGLAAVSAIGGAVVGWGVGAGLDQAVEKISDEGPLAVDVVSVGGLQGVVVPRAAEEFDGVRLPLNGDAYRLSSALGGGAAGFLVVSLVAYGLEDYPILIRGIDLVDVSCEDPSIMTHVTDAGGGELWGLALAFEVDGSQTRVSGDPEPSVESFDDPGPEAEWTFPRQVSQAEADNFQVIVTPKRSLCDFLVEITYAARGEEGALLISDNGRPFAVGDQTLATEESPIQSLYR